MRKYGDTLVKTCLSILCLQDLDGDGECINGVLEYCPRRYSNVLLLIRGEDEKRDSKTVLAYSIGSTFTKYLRLP